MDSPDWIPSRNLKDDCAKQSDVKPIAEINLEPMDILEVIQFIHLKKEQTELVRSSIGTLRLMTYPKKMLQETLSFIVYDMVLSKNKT